MTFPLVVSVVGGLIAGRRLSRCRRDPARFLATVSHELRTPLHAIVGWVNLLKNGNLAAAETARALAGIERNVRLEAQLIDELLDASQLLGRRARVVFAPVDFRAPVQAAVARAATAVRARRVNLHVRVPSSGITVAGDEHRLTDVVWHLLVNAVKFTPSGGDVWVDLDVLGDSVCLRVADTGEGMTPEVLPHVFEPFLQGQTRAKRAGLGLGLALARQTVALHNGTISAHSAGRDQGAVFRVTLPLVGSRFDWREP